MSRLRVPSGLVHAFVPPLPTAGPHHLGGLSRVQRPTLPVSVPPFPSVVSRRPYASLAAPPPSPSQEPPHTISSTKNALVKSVRAYQRRRARDRDGRILLEGSRLVRDALQCAHGAPIALFATAEALERRPAGDPATETGPNEHDIGELLHLARSRGARVCTVGDDVLASLCDTQTPQGIVALFERPSIPLPDPGTRPGLTLVLDAVADPGNVGALLRSAAAAGASAALLTSGCADAWSPKSLRAGMGAHFRLAVRTAVDWGEVEAYCRDADATLRIASAAEGATGYAQADWTRPSVLVVGSEARGPGAEALRLADETVAIDMAGEVESLNAAVAGAVVMFEAKRQRDAAGAP